MAASSICITCLLTYRAAVSFIRKEHKTEDIKDTHKGRGLPGFYSLPLRVLETHSGHRGPAGLGGSMPGVQTWLENSLCVHERRKVLCMNRPPSLSDIFSRAGPSEIPLNDGYFLIRAELKGTACRPDPRVTARKSRCGRQPAGRRSCLREIRRFVFVLL